jgi:RNA polymerase sigma-70 factor, ECF subfamily
MSAVDFVMGDGVLRQAQDVDVSARESPPSVDFRALFEREVSYVMRSLRRLGVAERDLEDVTHEVFLAVHRRLGTLDASRPAKPWLFAFALRYASHYRRSDRCDLPIEHAPDVRATEMGAEAVLERRDKQQLLLDALEAIDLERRAVFIMHELDDVGCQEIARSLGIPIGTVYSRLRLAREDLESAVKRLKAQRGYR